MRDLPEIYSKISMLFMRLNEYNEKLKNHDLPLNDSTTKDWINQVEVRYFKIFKLRRGDKAAASINLQVQAALGDLSCSSLSALVWGQNDFEESSQYFYQHIYQMHYRRAVEFRLPAIRKCVTLYANRVNLNYYFTISRSQYSTISAML